MNLKQKTVKNIGIVFSVTVFTRIIRFISTIILARLLVPEDFGLVAIAGLCIEVLALFKDVGVGQALIYKKDRLDDAANTTFILMPIIASILFAVAYFIAPFVAVFFGNLAVTDIIRLSAITFIFTAFGSVPMVLLEKELDFKRAMIPQAVSMTVTAFSSILLALIGFSFWSLVYGGLIGGFVGLCVIWKISSWRPNFKFDIRIAKELLMYGKHILAASIFIFLATNLDDALIGKMIGISALGLYTIAYRISNYPVTNITHLISSVMFPTYSKLQGDIERLKRAYMKTFKYVSLLAIPAAFGILIISHDFVYVLLKEKWIPSIALIQILCFYGLVRALGATTGEIFKATGKPKLLTFFTAMSLIIFVIFVIPVISQYGLIGVCVLVTISEGLTIVFALGSVNKILRISLAEFNNMIRHPFLAGSLALVFTVIVRSFILETSVLSLLVIFFGYSCSYLLLINTFDRTVKDEITEMFWMVAKK